MLAPSLSTKAWRRLKAHGAINGTPLLDVVSRYAARLRRLSLRRTTFIAVTGSCGKTTCTQLIRAILSDGENSVIGAENNSERATARAVLTLAHNVRYCIQELSGDQPGKIAKHVYALRPHIGIVTVIGSDHYKAYRTLEETAKEKGRLVEALPANGTAILNADDPHVRAMASRTRARVLTFGVSPDADIRASEVSSDWPDRLAFTVSYGGQSTRLQTRFPGEHWTPSVLASIACGIACGLDLATCAGAIEKVEPLFGRYSVHPVAAGPVFVLDSFKASFWTVASSLAFLRTAKAPRRTIVVGTVSDYAGNGSRTHRKVAREALAIADRVIFVGPHAAGIGKLREGAADRLFGFATAFEASRFVRQESEEGELILVKASISDHLERIALSCFDDVVCWRERCGKRRSCPFCRQYRSPSPPPLGSAETAGDYEAPWQDLLAQAAKLR